jgi:radical SAM superfamily enzyme YgiQ (UPF0313 family)
MRTLLLITPESPEIHLYRRRQFNNFVQMTMPYLAGYVNLSQYAVRLIDEYNQRIPFKTPFDLVALTVNTPNAPHCYQIADKFRSMGSKVVLGGPHVTLMPEEALPHCDHLICGEAEETWPLFLDEFHSGQANKMYRAAQPPSLEHIPLPRRDLIRRRLNTGGAVFASRGCPYQCSFCNLKQIYFPTFRTRPVEEVIRDIQSISQSHFVFWDDNFFCDPQYARQIMKALNGLNKRWAAQVSLDRCNDETLLQQARDSGCIYLFIGLETFSKAGIDEAHKTCNQPEDYAEIIKNIQAHGIAVQAGVIFGFDSDTPNVFKETLKACRRLHIDGVTASILTPLPKTPLYNRLQEENRLLTDDWAWYNGKTRVAFQPLHMSPQELFSGYMGFRKAFYSLPSILRRLTRKQFGWTQFIMNLGYRFSITN